MLQNFDLINLCVPLRFRGLHQFMVRRVCKDKVKCLMYLKLPNVESLIIEKGGCYNFVVMSLRGCCSFSKKSCGKKQTDFEVLKVNVDLE